MFTSIIYTIIGTEFQINSITVTLFSGSGPKGGFPVVAETTRKLAASTR